MVFDLGKQRGVSNIPNVLKGQNVLIPTGYGTAATNQTENYIYRQNAGDVTFETIYTVPTGKTFYLTDLVFASDDDGDDDGFLGIGDTPILMFVANMGNGSAGKSASHISFKIPMKFSSGTVLQFKARDADKNHITIIGWEE